MFRTHGAAFKGWQQVLLGGRGNSGRGLGGCVCRRVLTRSNGVTGGMSKFHHKIDKKYGLVKAVRVEPVAAATSFAWKTSMRWWSGKKAGLTNFSKRSLSDKQIRDADDSHHVPYPTKIHSHRLSAKTNNQIRTLIPLSTLPVFLISVFHTPLFLL